MSEHSETGRSESDSLFQGSMRTIGQVIESLREPLKLPRRSSAPATAATDIAEAGARRTPLADDKLPNDDEDDDESAPRYAQPPWCQGILRSAQNFFFFLFLFTFFLLFDFHFLNRAVCGGLG